MERRKENFKINRNTPLLSVVVPVYNTESFFDRCIRSILGQSYQNLEIIIVNDGSQGNICQLINDYADERILFINNEKNQGLLKARVSGANVAHGEYIAFIDSDDYISFDYYRSMVSKAMDTDADIVIGKTVWDDGVSKFIYNYHDSCFCFETLKGEEAREAFFGQEMQCYSWHTIWNKLYKKELWDNCSIWFNAIDKHIVMTEDIYFSSLLFYNTSKVVKVNNDAYFYCANSNAATNSAKISIEKYRKNMQDMIFVFDEVEKYLTNVSAKEVILCGFKNARKHYARMWENLALNVFADNEKREALQLVNLLFPVYKQKDENKKRNDYFFETQKMDWGGRIEYIKEKIANAQEEYISFDIFDTLILRNLYLPTDIYLFLNPMFSKKRNNNVVFSKIRCEGEELARRYYSNTKGYADITIDEIYKYIESHYSIEHDLCEEMKKYEKQLEIYFARPRETGKELLEMAISCGKKVILITDMYLKRDTIETILEKCGIKGYEKIFISCEARKLKYDGSLFEHVLLELQEKETNILHIGDTWKADIEGSNKVGINNIYLPKAKDIFENNIKEIVTDKCSQIGKECFENCTNYEKWKNNLGIRCMIALVINHYFDNPYRDFCNETDFNMDPYFMGYYLVGMHMLGVSKWIGKNIKEQERVIFLGRDGYLPWKAFDIYSSYQKSKVQTDYMQASRRALMPMIASDKMSFYQLPVEYKNHTLKTMYYVLYFAMEEISMEEWVKSLEKKGFDVDRRFLNIEDFHAFIKLFLEEFYSSKKHTYNKELVSLYYKAIQKNDKLFDMGYSGRIHSAICSAIGYNIDALFIHEDYENSVISRENNGYKIVSFYDYRPKISGLFREHLLSSTEGSCVAFEKCGDFVAPIIEDDSGYSTKYVVECIQKGALDFMEAFMGIFSRFIDIVDYSSYDASLPFEGFLYSIKPRDLQIFSDSYFEDIVYGAHKYINIMEFLQNEKGNITMCDADIEGMEKKLIDVMNDIPQWKRMIIWGLIDFSKFKEKIIMNLHRILKRRDENGF